MAAIRHEADVLVVLSGDRFIVFVDGGEDVNVKKSAASAKNCVLASAFSPSGKYFAVSDNDKQLHLYSVTTNWELVSTRSLARRCTALVFTHSETDIVVADRSGDVYKYSVLEPKTDGDLLLGHLSMILDVTLTRDDKYIVTTDRDEKVRISHYPGAYNIHTYCLLHTEYVSQIVFVDKFNCLISGSGDGNIAIWDVEGRSHDCVHEEIKCERSLCQGESQVTEVTDQHESECEPLAVKRMVYNESLNVLAVIYFRSKFLKLYTLHNNDGCIRLSKDSDVSLPEEPWDICFDGSHRLWVVKPCEHSPVMVYTCTRKDGTGKLEVTESSDDAVKNTVDKLKSKWAFFRASVDCQQQFLQLQKMRTHENVERYLEKKEERLSGKKNTTDQQPTPEKKIKIS